MLRYCRFTSLLNSQTVVFHAQILQVHQPDKHSDSCVPRSDTGGSPAWYLTFRQLCSMLRYCRFTILLNSQTVVFHAQILQVHQPVKQSDSCVPCSDTAGSPAWYLSFRQLCSMLRYCRFTSLLNSQTVVFHAQILQVHQPIKQSDSCVLCSDTAGSPAC